MRDLLKRDNPFLPEDILNKVISELEYELRTALEGFMFRPNDSFTRSAIESVATSKLFRVCSKYNVKVPDVRPMCASDDCSMNVFFVENGKEVEKEDDTISDEELENMAFDYYCEGCRYCEEACATTMNERHDACKNSKCPGKDYRWKLIHGFTAGFREAEELYKKKYDKRRTY